MIDLYILLLLSVCAASLNNTFMHKAALKEKKEIYVFNLGCSAVWIIILFAVNKCTFHINKEVVLWGLIYGIMQMLFFVFKTAAMTTGPVSVTTLVGNCSLLVSVVVSAVIWKEPIRLLTCVGIALLLLSVFLCSDTKADASLTRKWMIYCIGFFLFAAALGIVIKLFSKSRVGKTMPGDSMIVVAIVVMALLSILLVKEQLKARKCRKTGEKAAGESACRVIKQWGQGNGRLNRRYVALMIACGILSCGYNRLNVFLTRQLPGAFFFSAFNGGVIIVAAILSAVLLKEKMTLRKILGLVIGCVAIVALGI